MREFEKYIERHLEDKILYIDLASASKRQNNGRIYLNLGVKVKEKHNFEFIGMVWKTVELDVEDDFSISEFQNTCDKYNIAWSIFAGDNERYELT